MSQEAYNQSLLIHVYYKLLLFISHQPYIHIISGCGYRYLDLFRADCAKARSALQRQHLRILQVSRYCFAGRDIQVEYLISADQYIPHLVVGLEF